MLGAIRRFVLGHPPARGAERRVHADHRRPDTGVEQIVERFPVHRGHVLEAQFAQQRRPPRRNLVDVDRGAHDLRPDRQRSHARRRLQEHVPGLDVRRQRHEIRFRGRGAELLERIFLRRPRGLARHQIDYAPQPGQQPLIVPAELTQPQRRFGQQIRVQTRFRRVIRIGTGPCPAAFGAAKRFRRQKVQGRVIQFLAAAQRRLDRLDQFARARHQCGIFFCRHRWRADDRPGTILLNPCFDGIRQPRQIVPGRCGDGQRQTNRLGRCPGLEKRIPPPVIQVIELRVRLGWFTRLQRRIGGFSVGELPAVRCKPSAAHQ